MVSRVEKIQDSRSVGFFGIMMGVVLVRISSGTPDAQK